MHANDGSQKSERIVTKYGMCVLQLDSHVYSHKKDITKEYPKVQALKPYNVIIVKIIHVTCQVLTVQPCVKAHTSTKIYLILTLF